MNVVEQYDMGVERVLRQLDTSTYVRISDLNTLPTKLANGEAFTR